MKLNIMTYLSYSQTSKKERYEPHYKHSRDDMNQYVNDFSKLPQSLE